MTFVAVVILIGVIVSLTTSGVFTQAQKKGGQDPNKDPLIDSVAAQQGDSNDGEGSGEEEDDQNEDAAQAEDDAEDKDDEGEKEFTTSFMAENCTFDSAGRTPFFILEPNYRLVLKGVENGATKVGLTITVLDETKDVDGTEARIVEERHTENDSLVEVSSNYFAICEETNNVFYFGEDVDMYENGEIVSHEGAWLAGENNNRAGIIMPGTPLLGVVLTHIGTDSITDIGNTSG